MTKSKHPFVLLIALLLCTCVRAQNPTPAPRQLTPIAVTGATIHVGDGTVIENGTLLVSEGKIMGVGADLTVPAGYETVDATGKDLYPGLIALNSQLGLTEIGAVRATNDQREVGTFNPERPGPDCLQHRLSGNPDRAESRGTAGPGHPRGKSGQRTQQYPATRWLELRGCRRTRRRRSAHQLAQPQ